MRAGQLKEPPMANDGLVLNDNDNKSHIKYNRKYNTHICWVHTDNKEWLYK